MTDPASQLLAALQALDLRDRAEIAATLIQSLDEDEAGNFDEAWDQELAKRKEEILSGKVKGIPADEVFAKLTRKYS